jgi:hypothetical protein
MEAHDRDYERRKFLRYDYAKHLSYKTVSPMNTTIPSGAQAKNLSASGLLFTVQNKQVPGISSLLAIDIDYRTANICQEIEEHVLISQNRLLGRVVRLEENSDGSCSVGIVFLTKQDPISQDIDKLLK